MKIVHDFLDLQYLCKGKNCVQVGIVIKLDGYSDIYAHERSNLCYLTCY